MSISGILNVDKPKGKTSYGVIAWLKRLSGEKRIGHAGTLDPLATGVLPVCFGQSTKVIQFLMNSVKTYFTEVRLGVSTDTYDCDGNVTSYGDVTRVTREQVEKVLNSFQGFIRQTPPVYSALKFHGQRYYDLARAGVSVEPRVRYVQVFSVRLKQWSPPLLAMEVECGRGTYIRSLVHELGQVLGCGACVSGLLRLSYGPFHIGQAINVAGIESAFATNSFVQLLFPPDTALPNWPKVVISKDQEFLIKNGHPLSLFERLPVSFEYYRVYSTDGRFIAVLRFNASTVLWHPLVVFGT